MKIVIDIPDDDLHEIKCEGIKFIRQREMLWRAIENGTVLSKDEWEDYSIDFYKCPECGYLLEKCCPHCGNRVVLPVSNSEV